MKMIQTITDRYDPKNPFDVVRAEDFGERLFEFYEPLEAVFKELTGIDVEGSRTVFLTGGRGTGKTMILKSLSFDMKLNEYNKNRKKITDYNPTKFIFDQKYYGIYLRFRSIEYDVFTNETLELFKPYLSIKIAERLFNLLNFFKTYDALTDKEEFKLCSFFQESIRIDKKISLNTISDVIKYINDELLLKMEYFFEKSAYLSLNEIKKEISLPLVLSNKIFFELSEILFSIPKFRGKKLFILFDELEFLKEEHQRYIFELIRGSDETPVIFKIGSRYLPSEMKVGNSDQFLQEPHDVRIINITDILNSAESISLKNKYGYLIKNILNIRIKKSEYFEKKGINNIEQLLPTLSPIEEALMVVDKKIRHWSRFKKEIKDLKEDEKYIIIKNLQYEKNPLIEKLNMLLYYRGLSSTEINKMMNGYLKNNNKKYKLLYDKNEYNLLFQLCNDYRVEKKYVGIDAIVYLSSGIIRNAIEMCNQILNIAYSYGHGDDGQTEIDYRYQDLGIKRFSRLLFDDVARIPGNLGLAVQDFINQIGEIFRALHIQDIFLSEPEPTHFETEYLEISGDAKKVFDAALRYSFLQKKPPMKSKQTGDVRRDDFVLNRAFAPLFGISYRVRGRTYISSKNISNLITYSKNQKNRIRRMIIRSKLSHREISSKRQSTLLRFEESESL